MLSSQHHQFRKYIKICFGHLESNTIFYYRKSKRFHHHRHNFTSHETFQSAFCPPPSIKTPLDKVTSSLLGPMVMMGDHMVHSAASAQWIPPSCNHLPHLASQTPHCPVLLLVLHLCFLCNSCFSHQITSSCTIQ